MKFLPFFFGRSQLTEVSPLPRIPHHAGLEVMPCHVANRHYPLTLLTTNPPTYSTGNHSNPSPIACPTPVRTPFFPVARRRTHPLVTTCRPPPIAPARPHMTGEVCVGYSSAAPSTLTPPVLQPSSSPHVLR